MARRARRPPFRVCRRCRSLVPREATKCPNCGSTDLSDDWEGTMIVLRPEESELAKKLGIDKPGRYALRVR